jgi:hypothetical protein
MQLKNVLGSFSLAASLAAATTGCLVEGHARVAEPVAVVEVDEEPPPPRTVVVETRPGFIWIEGRWVRGNNRWVWRDGYYERERAGYVWEQGRWENRGGRHVWVEGRWNSGGPARREPARGPAVRDHR